MPRPDAPVTGDRKSVENLNKNINQELAQDIIAAIDVWASARTIPVSSELKASLFNLFYKQFFENKKMDKALVRDYLKFVN